MGKLNRVHQTAVFFDGRALQQNFDNYQNRAKRLMESLGGPNIKVDVYTVFGGNVETADIVSGLSFDAPAAATSFDGKALRNLARAAGYNMALVAYPAAHGWDD